ncbi:MAG: hypothetical protein COU81_02185 [Candidatus Portnoybacteria bacterium CG10_big_fil_rev_8_21_14_0_10_36_7]|uniref:GtrA/DPMS transmembrane domain-containing protein n=1 Tax=Candidatus Portnoybacteria bacterium CG10_big_fil_rev_8_21_14_0_10_36_7 TaxID=1974812 RepID=A0A2M8KE12_9BACT|nr:MAG: hypothetical protein COU81_02185 [Candidatus Portnoybacteria bacterium CG10_big_fil_rev_8_21_14_0_10_36_7]
MEFNQSPAIHFGKKEAIISLVIGELIAWLAWPIILNVDNFEVVKNLFWFAPIAFPILALIGSWVGYFIGRKVLVIYQLVKFFQVGLLNTFLDIGVFNVLILLLNISQEDYRFSYFKSISFLTASTNSYFWNRYWSFSEKRANGVDKKAEFAKFITVSVIVFIVNLGISTYIFKVFSPSWLSTKEWATVSAIFGVIFSMIANFVGYKFIVFKA